MTDFRFSSGRKTNGPLIHALGWQFCFRITNCVQVRKNMMKTNETNVL